MNKRITQIGNIKSLQLPRQVERENTARIGPRDVPVPVPGSRPQTLKKRTLGILEHSESSLARTTSVGSTDSVEPVESSSKKVKRRIENGSKPLYHEWMELDQAGPAVIGCDNTRAGIMVAIKRIKKTGQDDLGCMPPFINDHVVNVKDMYCKDNEITIVYEQMDVSLRQITGILSGQLQAFEIAAICKEVIDHSQSYC